MKKNKLTPLSVLVDDAWGKKGTPERDGMEVRLKEELNAYYVGESIKKARFGLHGQNCALVKRKQGMVDIYSETQTTRNPRKLLWRPGPL